METNLKHSNNRKKVFHIHGLEEIHQNLHAKQQNLQNQSNLNQNSWGFLDPEINAELHMETQETQDR